MAVYYIHSQMLLKLFPLISWRTAISSGHAMEFLLADCFWQYTGLLPSYFGKTTKIFNIYSFLLFPINHTHINLAPALHLFLILAILLSEFFNSGVTAYNPLIISPPDAGSSSTLGHALSPWHGAWVDAMELLGLEVASQLRNHDISLHVMKYCFL